MKRTPLAIVTDLVVTLNTLLIDQEYSTNSLAEISHLHWESVSRYLKILSLASYFSPKFLLTSKNKIKILSKNTNIPIDREDLVLVHCLQNKALDEQNAILLTDSFIFEINRLIEKEYCNLTESRKMFLTPKGKMLAVDIFLQIQTFIESVISGEEFLVPETDYSEFLADFRKSPSFDILANELAEVIAEKVIKREDNEIEVS
ncbi:MAG: hypothetical protein ACXAC6_06565 [Candidatus Hodarchaeales archaeon]|jgi:hypothetical protein